jgi:hypothetical protein
MLVASSKRLLEFYIDHITRKPAHTAMSNAIHQVHLHKEAENITIVEVCFFSRSPLPSLWPTDAQYRLIVWIIKFIYMMTGRTEGSTGLLIATLADAGGRSDTRKVIHVGVSLPEGMMTAQFASGTSVISR